MNLNEIITKEDLLMHEQKMTARLDRLEKIITGQLADDKWIDSKDAKEIIGTKNNDTLKNKVLKGQIRVFSKKYSKVIENPTEDNLRHAGQKAYNKFDCLKLARGKHTFN